MPSFLTEVLGFDLGSAGILCVFPYLALFISTLSFARMFDYLQREHAWTANSVRRTAMFTTFIGSGLGLVICGFLGDKYAAYTFMIITQVKRKLFFFYVFSSRKNYFLMWRSLG
jgi:MFS transporter, ACS family, solute carrier family 17 (sodium-dependent inorganic phosphate cotransporter), other